MSDFLPRTIEDLAHEFPPELQHISASSINMALRCEEQWRQVYIKGIRRPPSLAQLAGRADHAAIEQAMRRKIETGADVPVAEVEETFLSYIEDEVERTGGIEELEDKPTRSVWDATRTHGMAVVAGYHRIISPTITPIAVEASFALQVPELPVQIEGRIDLVEPEQIIDRKRTSSNRGIKPEWKLQGRIYQLVEPKPYRWHISVTTNRPQYVTKHTIDDLQSEKTLRHLSAICAKLGFLYRRYGPDDPWPATGVTHDWACKYCGFRDTCWAWA